MNKIDRIISKLEHAGGNLSEAAQLVNELTIPHVANLIASVNVSTGDLRRAMVRINNGEDIETVRRELEMQLRENFE